MPTPEELLADPFAPEELHPDLKAHCHTIEIGEIIQHPLVYSVPHAPPLNRMVNAQYAHKRALLETSIKEGNFVSYVNLHEKPWRLDAFLDVCDGIKDPAAYWDLLVDVWMRTEIIRVKYDIWLDLWRSDSWALAHTTSEGSLAALAQMPPVLTIWRGLHGQNDIDGLSWTLTEHDARWFACRHHRKSTPEGPFLAKATIPRSLVRAYLPERGEEEIVALPEHITIESVEPITRMVHRRRG